MWCANCQAEVAAEVLDNNRTVLCANCQSELGSLRGASADERTRQARELLERWAQSGITDPLSPHARSRDAAADTADSSAPTPPAGDRAAEQAPPQQPASPDSPPAAVPSLDTETDGPAGPTDESPSRVPAPGRATAAASPKTPVASTGGRRLRFDTAEHTSEHQAIPPARSSVRTRSAESSPESRQAPRQQIRFDQPHGEPSGTPDHRAPADPGPARTARDERDVSAEAPSEHPEHRPASPHSRRDRHPEPEADYEDQPAPSEPAVRFHQPEHGPHSARRSRRQRQEPAYYADQTEEDDYQEQAPPSQPPYHTPHQRPPQQPPEQVVRRVTSVRPRRPHFADVTEQRSRVHAPHAAAPQPHFDVQAFMEPAPETPANWLSIVGPVLAYLGVGLLTVGTVLVLWAWFGGPASYAPTGWLITTAGQMLLFLGIVTLVSGGMEQTTTEVRTRISHLGERILRMEHASRDHALRGPSIPSENFDPASRPARSRERARSAQPRRRRQ